MITPVSADEALQFLSNQIKPHRAEAHMQNIQSPQDGRELHSLESQSIFLRENKMFTQ